MAAVNKIKIRAFNNQEIFKDSVSIDSAKSFEIDFSAWSEEYGNISSVTWSVESGDASISDTSLTSNVASALISFGQVGRNMIKIIADTGAEKYVVWIDIYVRDPNFDYVNDYDY